MKRTEFVHKDEIKLKLVTNIWQKLAQALLYFFAGIGIGAVAMFLFVTIF